MEDLTIIKKAIAKIGGVQATADVCGVKQPSVSSWNMRGQIPAKHCPAISKHSGIPLHELRDDIYPAPETQPAGE